MEVQRKVQDRNLNESQEKVKVKRKVHVPNPEFERITRSKKHISEIYTEATRRALTKEAPLLRPQYLIPKSTAHLSSTALSYAEVTKKSLNLNVLPEKQEITNLINEKDEKAVNVDVKNDEKVNLNWSEDEKWNKLFEIKQNDATPLHFDKCGLPIKRVGVPQPTSIESERSRRQLLTQSELNILLTGNSQFNYQPIPTINCGAVTAALREVVNHFPIPFEVPDPAPADP